MPLSQDVEAYLTGAIDSSKHVEAVHISDMRLPDERGAAKRPAEGAPEPAVKRARLDGALVAGEEGACGMRCREGECAAPLASLTVSVAVGVTQDANIATKNI